MKKNFRRKFHHSRLGLLDFQNPESAFPPLPFIHRSRGREKYTTLTREKDTLLTKELTNRKRIESEATSLCTGTQERKK